MSVLAESYFSGSLPFNLMDKSGENYSLTGCNLSSVNILFIMKPYE